MLPFDSNQPLKVIRKLFKLQLNIGTEGELNCYLCNTLQTDTLAEVLLVVFISTYEDTSIKLAIQTPEDMDNIPELMDELIVSLAEAYKAISIHERNQHELLQ